jgi:FkbM family methyltransferase
VTAGVVASPAELPWWDLGNPGIVNGGVNVLAMTTVRAAVRRWVPPEVKTWTRATLEKVNRMVGVAEVPPPHAQPEPAPTPVETAQHDASQAGETTALLRLLRPDFPRFLVDVGAHDGISISNSRTFVVDGWDAILIEPHPELFAKLQAASADLPGVHCLNIACSDTAGEFPLYLGTNDPDTTLSTLCTDDNPFYDIMRSNDSVLVQVKTLNDVLGDFESLGEISVLMVDAEGMDYEVLLGLDFERYRPRIIVTEEYIINPQKHRNKYRLLLDKDYTFHSMVGSNTIWIANEWVEVCLGISSAASVAG